MRDYVDALPRHERDEWDEEAASHLYRDVTNKKPQPFIWTKTAAQILDSIPRFCQRISNSGH